MALADLITLHDEEVLEGEYTIFDPSNTWKRKILKDYYVKELQVKIFENGNQIYFSPTLKEIAQHSKEDLETFWEEIKRMDNPHKYFVDLSNELYSLNLTPNKFENTGYKYVFELYDRNDKVSQIEKYFIVR